jgi:hypothetical protein
MIRLLLKKGADVAVLNRQGFTPVRMAIANANALAVDALGGRASMVPMDDARIFNGSDHGEGCKYSCALDTLAAMSQSVFIRILISNLSLAFSLLGQLCG